MKVLWLIGLFGLSASVQAAAAATERSAVQSSFADLPLTFEVNQGQTDGRVDFLARGQGYNIFLTGQEAVFALSPPSTSSKRSGNGRESDAPQPGGTVMRMQFMDSASDPEVSGLEELPGKVNYFRGNDSSKWRTNVRTYRKVRYSAVYPGVDLVYYGQPRQLEYDFIVSPGADPSVIQLAFSGVDAMTVDARGDLVLKTAGGPLRFQKPIIYQVESGRRHIVDGGYVQISPHEIGFRVGDYDPARPLIIDPVLSYSTFLGGNLSDSGTGIAVDATGAAYVGGETSSSDFPTINPLQPEIGGRAGVGGERDAFVARITSDGTALVYATYLGGLGAELETHIAVDAVGNAYVTGSTPADDFPTVRPLQSALAGLRDVFVAKLSADGSQLIYSTYLGGRDTDRGKAIAVDLAGAAYITGMTFSRDFPAQNAFQPACTEPPPHIRPENGFVAKLAPDGAALAYSTYLGGSSSDSAEDIAVDTRGSAYVTGFTSSADFPTVNAVQPFSGSELFSDAFVAKFSPSGSSLIYSTHLGGNLNDEGHGIAADVSGAAYVTGVTNSPDFPTVNALQPLPGAFDDAFVVKLPPEGGALMYATPLGGSMWEQGLSIAVDSAGAASVTGWTQSPDFPTMNPVQSTLGGFEDVFVAKLRPDGAALVYSTYLGGISEDVGEAIALDLAGAAYLTGFTWSADFATVQPLQAIHGGSADAFIAKITDDSLAAAPGNESESDGQSSGSGGGGGIDALLAAVLLAQFALACALRNSMRRVHGAKRDCMNPLREQLGCRDPVSVSGISPMDAHRSKRSPRYRALTLIGLLALLASARGWAQAPVIFGQRLGPIADDFALVPLEFIDFGEVVAISGSTAMVGIPNWSEEGLGRVGVYTRTAERWLRTATISSPDVLHTRFGRAIDLDDDDALIDADTAAYLFRQDGEQWRLVATFISSDPAETVGLAVEYNNGFLARSIQRDANRPGLVHLYRHDEDDVRLVARLCASDRTPGDRFGESLAMEDGVLVAGAPGLEAAYVFVDDGQRWVQRQKLVSSDGGGGFGTSVAIDDGVILVGAPKVDLPSNDFFLPAGNAYVFLPHGGTWFESQRLNDDSRFIAEFGTNVALSHELAAVVTPDDDFMPRPGSYVVAFDRVGAELTSGRPVFSADGHFGQRVFDVDLSERVLIVGVGVFRRFGDTSSAHVLEFGAIGAGAGESIAAAPENDSGRGDQNDDGSGGGSIDALLALLLAQLALAHALRQRSRSCINAKRAVSVISLMGRRA